MRWEKYVECVGERGDICNPFIGKSERKRQIERPGNSWEDNNKIVLREAGREFTDLIYVAQDRKQ
jgi:hypothetical protein